MPSKYVGQPTRTERKTVDKIQKQFLNEFSTAGRWRRGVAPQVYALSACCAVTASLKLCAPCKSHHRPPHSLPPRRTSIMRRASEDYDDDSGDR